MVVGWSVMAVFQASWSPDVVADVWLESGKIMSILFIGDIHMY